MRRRRMAEVNKPPRFSARKTACLLTNLSKEACLYAGADWLKLFGHCVSQRVARGQLSYSEEEKIVLSHERPEKSNH